MSMSKADILYQRLEDDQGIKAAFIEGYYQAMKNTQKLIEGESK
tara:strand:- start:205 stop:336 length:132 start_codon:yes stop_codon:yes gene_type:complete